MKIVSQSAGRFISRRIILVFALLPAAAGSVRAATNDLTSILQQALFEEEANRNLDAAIQAYQTLVNQFDKDRQVAATAVFRLGECYRKLGRTNDAVAQYQRILSEFSDQDTLATLSRQDLAGMGAAPAGGPPGGGPAGVALTAAGRAQQRDLIEQEIKIAEQKLNATQAQANAALVPTSEVLDRQRDLLELKRQLVAVTEAAPSAESQPVAVVTDDEDQEIRRIQEMIKNSPDLINGLVRSGANNENSLTPLGQAAAAGQVRVAEFLLDHGADVEKFSSQSGNISPLSPLMLAADAGHNTLVQLLLGRGAHVNAANPGGWTALHLAVLQGFTTVTETLLASNANPNTGCFRYGFAGAPGLTTGVTPLQLAANEGNPALVRLFLAKGANINATNSLGRTALSIVADNATTVQTLLAAGADPSVADVAGYTPLHYAARDGATEASKDLLAHGAPVNARDAHGATPLCVAAANSHPDVVAVLLQYHADPGLPGEVTGSAVVFDNRQWEPALPIAYAISREDEETLKLLLDHGADPEARAVTGQPRPLSEAVSRADARAVESLLQHKANPNWVALDEQPPLMAATWFGLTNVVRELLDHGAAPNVTLPRGSAGYNGDTPLHWAVERNHPGVAELLLEHGADPNIQNAAGRTPLDLADAGNAPGAPGGAPLSYQWQSLPSASEPPHIIGRRPRFGGEIPGAVEPAGPDVARLLRQHGALADLPKADAIEVRRAGGPSDVVFRENTNGWNHFTLFAAIYRFYTVDHTSYSGGSSWSQSASSFMPYPDLARITIVRHAPGTTNEARISVDLSNGTNGIDCSKDVPLEFGDAVEIPERLHPMGQAPIGLSPEENTALSRCLEGAAELVTSGHKLELRVWSNLSLIGNVLDSPQAQNALLSSADLSRVKVTRRDPKTGQPLVWWLDCSQLRKNRGNTGVPDFYVRNGDIIEVFDKS